MVLVKQIILSFLLLCVVALTQAAPSCDPDKKVVKLLEEMIGNAKLSKVIQDNGELSKYWNNIGTEDLIDAWTVLESDKNLRKDPDNIKKMHIFIEFSIRKDGDVENKDQAIKNLAKSFKSQTSDADKKKWLKLKYNAHELEAKYATMSQNPPPKLTPWTKEHKAQRWNNYKEGGGDKSYVAWSNIYDGNINKSKRADEAAEKYAKTLPGNVKREQTYKDKDGIIKDITINLNGKTVTGKRRHDIIQTDALGNVSAIEVKDYRSGKVYLSEDIKREALMDIELLDPRSNSGIDKVEWVFIRHGENGEPSRPLKEFLEDNGIKVIIK